MLPNSFYDTVIILTLKLDKDITKKEDHILISLKNIDSGTLQNTWKNNPAIFKKATMTQVEFIPEMQVWFIIQNSTSPH